MQIRLARAHVEPRAMIVEVRLAHLRRAVAGALQQLEQRFVGCRKLALIRPDAMVVRIETARKRRACRHADRRHRRRLAETDPFAGDAIDVRRS